MRNRLGRPLKYRDLLHTLDEYVLQSAGSIAIFADLSGYVAKLDPMERRAELKRIRIAMGRYSNRAEFPDKGDGMVTLKGQSPTPGWYGWRWKKPLE